MVTRGRNNISHQESARKSENLLSSINNFEFGCSLLNNCQNTEFIHAFCS